MKPGTHQTEKRTFWQFLERDSQLAMRQIWVLSLWHIFHSFHPFRSLFAMRRFKRVLGGLQKQRVENAKKGYWG